MLAFTSSNLEQGYEELLRYCLKVTTGSGFPVAVAFKQYRQIGHNFQFDVSNDGLQEAAIRLRKRPELEVGYFIYISTFFNLQTSICSASDLVRPKLSSETR